MGLIIAAYDGSDNSKRALYRAIELAKLEGAELEVLTIIPEEAHMLAFEDVLIPETFEERYREIAEEGVKLAKDRGVDAKVVVKGGDVAHEILEACDERGCDLIVIGKKGYGRIGRFLMGSITQKVLKYARSSVLVVH